MVRDNSRRTASRSSAERISRRSFLASAGALGIELGFGSGLRVAVDAVGRKVRPTSDSQATVLVTVFLRGAADGLNIVVPHADPWYATHRRRLDDSGLVTGDIVVDTSSMTPLSDDFTLNPAASALQALYDEGDLLIVQAAGPPEPERSHFAAMDHVDYAFSDEGWLHRATGAAGATAPHHRLSIGRTPSPSLNSHSGQGLSMASAADLLGTGLVAGQRRSLIESMYLDGVSGSTLQTPVDTELATPTLAGLSLLDVLADSPLPDESDDAQYPDSGVGPDLSAAAQLIKADIGCRAITVDYGGWDHHIDEMADHKLPMQLSTLAQALAAFRTDLGSDWARTVVVVMSEFGRTVRVNGGMGTDHGYGNIMMLLGGQVLGGQVYLRGGWPGLAPENLNEDRDLWVTTDFRDVFAEVLRHQFGSAAVASALGSYLPVYLDVMGQPPPDGEPEGPVISAVTPGLGPEQLVDVTWRSESSAGPPWAVGTDMRVLDATLSGPTVLSTSALEGERTIQMPDDGSILTKVALAWRISGGGHSQWTLADLPSIVGFTPTGNRPLKPDFGGPIIA